MPFEHWPRAWRHYPSYPRQQQQRRPQWQQRPLPCQRHASNASAQMWICDGRRKDPRMHCSIKSKFICHSLQTNQSILSKQKPLLAYQDSAHHGSIGTLHQASWVIPLLVPEVRAACAAATACCSKVMLCCSARASAAAAATAALRSEEARQDAHIHMYTTYIMCTYIYIYMYVQTSRMHSACFTATAKVHTSAKQFHAQKLTEFIPKPRAHSKGGV